MRGEAGENREEAITPAFSFSQTLRISYEIIIFHHFSGEGSRGNRNPAFFLIMPYKVRDSLEDL
jgi:hypothetical protein